MSNYELHLGDCLEVMRGIDQCSVDAIITDIPYGTTACKWDTVIPLDEMWPGVKRVLKPNGAFVTTASQPFTSALVMSNLEWFKYEIIWDKITGTDMYQAKNRPMKAHENILIFCEESTLYNPIMSLSNPKNRRDRVKNYSKPSTGTIYGDTKKYISTKCELERYPISMFRHSMQAKELHRTKRKHPTQKPVALYEYLIRTYSNPGDTILDITMGSGTTGVACMQTGRDFIGIELDPQYFEIAQERIAKAAAQPPLFVDTSPAQPQPEQATFDLD